MFKKFIYSLILKTLLNSNQHCYKIKRNIIRTYGFTKDPESGD
jgi:hypothetical protein